MLCHQGTDDTSDEDHDHHAVKHVIVHQILSGSHLQPHTHHHHRDGTCRMGGCQAEHHIAIGFRQTEKKTGDIGGSGLSESTEKGNEEHDPQYVDTRKEGAHIDEHTHTYQEIGDEQGITDKLDAVHQGRDVWDISVEDQSGEERAEDSLDTNERGEGCTEEHDAQHEDILHHRITISAEEIASQFGNQDDAARTEGCELHHEEYPEQPATTALEGTGESCQHHQSHKQRNHR